MTGLVSSRPAKFTCMSSFKGSSQFSVHSSQFPSTGTGVIDSSQNYSGRPNASRPRELLEWDSHPSDKNNDVARVGHPVREGGAPSFWYQAVTGSWELTLVGVSQPKRSGLRPLAMAKNSSAILRVISPGLPSPMRMRSMERMGETSAAVPVKKTSSEIYSSSRGMGCSITV